MSAESKRPVLQDGTWDMHHGSWVTVDDGAVTLHLVRPATQEYHNEDLSEAQALLVAWGLEAPELVNKGFDEDGDLFELR